MNTYHVLGSALGSERAVLLHITASSSKNALAIASRSASSVVVLFATRERVAN